MHTYTCADASSIQEVSSLRTRRSSISLFGPTVRNVPKSVNFFETDGRYCSFSTPTCHISFSIPRRLADKKSDSQTTDYSDKLLHSNYPKPRFSAKSQEVRSLSCSEIHLHRYGISDATKFSQGPSGSCTEPNSNYQENNVNQTYRHELSFPFCIQTIQSLGFLPNLKKSDLFPAQKFTFIGMEFLMQQNLVKVPADRTEPNSNYQENNVNQTYRHELSFPFGANSVLQQTLFS